MAELTPDTVTVTDAPLKAKALYEARRTRVPIAPFTDAEPHLTLADGYSIQQAHVPMLLDDGDEIVGFLVGLTTVAMQKLKGVDTPDFGTVLGSTRYGNGDEVPVSRYIAPKMEAEISFVMGERLSGPDVTVEQARAAIRGAVASNEIEDSRVAGWRVRQADTVAVLASTGAFVASDDVVPIAGIDTRLGGMVLSRNGEVIDTGAGAAALGDPVAVVAWLADVLGDRGIALEPGHLVMTGALPAAVPMAAGDTFRVVFDRLGTVEARIVTATG